MVLRTKVLPLKNAPGTKLSTRAPIILPRKRFRGHEASVLNRENSVAGKTLRVDEVALRVVALAQVLCEKPFYPYQVELGKRFITSLLDHDGAVITALMARQVGKTEVVGAICAAASIILPILAKQHPQDWRLNVTDDKGIYRGFKNGLKVGIYAPRQEQAEITFDRVRRCFESKSASKVLAELGLVMEINNGNRCELANGSVVMCQSASEQSKIEGATHHLLVIEEAQDVTDMKIRKSLHPMVATTMGTIVKIGTASNQRCDFYNAINTNRRSELLTGVKNHFFYPYTVCEKYNSLYAKYIVGEKERIGEQSDEFRMSYMGEWIFERGMFVTQDALLSPSVAQISGPASLVYKTILPREFQTYSVVLGIDWGKTHDATVATLLAVDWNNPFTMGGEDGSRYVYYRKHVLGWVDFQGDNYEDQFGKMEDTLFKFPNLAKIVTDSNTCGQPMYDRLCSVFKNRRIEVCPFNFTPKLKSDGYKSLSADLVTGRVTFPASVPVRRTTEYRKFMLQMLELRKSYKSGLMVVAHPDEKGAHDDYPDSLMLAAWGACTPAVTSSMNFSNKNVFMV